MEKQQDMTTSDGCIALAIEEVRQPQLRSTAKLLADHTIRKVSGEFDIARVDRDEADGSVIIYFGLINSSYFLSVQVDPLPAPQIRGARIAAGVECWLTCSTTVHPLSALLAATHLVPDEQWDMSADVSSSGVSIKPQMPLADSVDDNVGMLLNILEQDAGGIQQLASLSIAVLEVHWHGPLRQLPRILLKPATLQRVAALHVALDFHINVG